MVSWFGSAACWISLLGVVWSGWLMADCAASPEAMARPVRPKSFASPDDLRTYLDQLGQYYAVAGRPRFGKRVGHAPGLLVPMEGANLRFPETNDLYDLLYQQAQDD